MTSRPGLVWEGSVAKIQSLSEDEGVYHGEIVLGQCETLQ